MLIDLVPHSAAMARRVVLLLALVLAGASAMGAARAPGDPTLSLTGPDTARRGQVVDFTLQVTGLAAAPEAGAVAVLNMPPNVYFVSRNDQDDDSGGCISVNNPRIATCTVTKPATTLIWHVRASFEPQLTPGDQVTIVATFGDLTVDKVVTVTPGADLGIAKVIGPKLPLTAGQPFRFTVVVHNYGPAAVAGFDLGYSMVGGWYRGYGSIVSGGPGECFSDPGIWQCEIHRPLAAGADLSVEMEMRTFADAETWGTKGQIHPQVYDQPGTPESDKNNRAAIPIRFAPKPGSATPGPGGGETGGDDGGLPVTGTATLPLAASGVLLLLAGAGALLLTRRRPTRR